MFDPTIKFCRADYNICSAFLLRIFAANAPVFFALVFKILSNLFFACFPLSEKFVDSDGGFINLFTD